MNHTTVRKTIQLRAPHATSEVAERISTIAERASNIFSEIVHGTYDDSRSPQSVGDRVQIIGITRNDLFGSAPSDHNNTGVDDVRRRRVPQNLPHESGMFLGELVHSTSGEESRQLGLGPASPGLREDSDRNRRTESLLKNPAMKSPHCPLAPLSGNERTRVVDVAAHEARRRALRVKKRSAAASSAVVNAPCSASHSATPRSPSSIRNACSAASFNHDETLTPRRSAAACTAVAVPLSRAIESFRTVIGRW